MGKLLALACFVFIGAQVDGLKCKLSFEAIVPKDSVGFVKFEKVVQAINSSQCAVQCYEQNCKRAAYSAISQRCFFLKIDSDADAECAFVERHFDYPTKETISIQCIRPTCINESQPAIWIDDGPEIIENKSDVKTEVTVIADGEDQNKQPLAQMLESTSGGEQTKNDELLETGDAKDVKTLEKNIEIDELPAEDVTQSEITVDRHFFGPYVCRLTFSVEPLYLYPIGDSLTFAHNKLAASAAECAGFCFLQACTRAVYDPLTKLCSLTLDGDIPDSCSTASKDSVYYGKDQIWIQCPTCDALPLSNLNETPEMAGLNVKEQHLGDLALQVRLKQQKSVKHDIVQRRINKASLNTVREPSESCVIGFEVDESIVDDGQFTDFTFTVTAANCARRCLASHCTEAIFQPSTGRCLMALNETKKQCDNDAELTAFHRVRQPFGISCIKCVKDSRFQRVFGAETVNGPFDQWLTTTESTTTNATTTPSTSANSTATPSNSTNSTTTPSTSTNSTTTNATTTNDTATQTPSTTTTPPTTTPKRGCWFSFEVATAERDLAKFSEYKATTSVYKCVRHCYQTGCSQVTWNPELKLCFYSYDPSTRNDCNPAKRHRDYLFDFSKTNIVTFQCLRLQCGIN